MKKLLVLVIVLLLVAGWNESFMDLYNRLCGATDTKTLPAGVPAVSQHNASEYHDVLLIVEGKAGVGSGFLCNFGGRTFAMTNAHVISSNPGFKLSRLNSEVLSVTTGAVAVGHDIVKLEVGTSPRGLDVMENMDAHVKEGDAVMVLGNISGGMVVKPVEGKVVGIGPDRIEVDAPFLPGNSGSPIIHKATGKVLGIATYLLLHKVGRGINAVTDETRRFGYRLDSVKTWETIDWPRFTAQAALVEKIEALSDDFIHLFTNSISQSKIGSYKTPAIQRAVQTYYSQAQSDRRSRITRLLDDLRFACRGDMASFNSQTSYDYFRRKVEEQSTLRDAVYVELSRVIEARK